MKTKSVFLFFIGLISYCACNDEPEESIPVKFDFRLLDKNGIPSTSFAQEENFVFSFLVINDSDVSVRFLQSIESDDFLRVYKIFNNPEGGSLIEIGKPYKTMFCTYQSGYSISPHDTLKIQIPWQPVPWDSSNPHYTTVFCLVNENEPLNPGKYSTRFKPAFHFLHDDSTFITPEKEFEINFNVQ